VASLTAPLPEPLQDAECAYREHVAWARMFAIRDARTLFHLGAPLEWVEDAVRHASDLNRLNENGSQAIQEVIGQLLESASVLIRLRISQVSAGRACMRERELLN
jgi:hypothetical protein